MPRRISANELLRKRFQKWQDDDPSSLVTKQIEKATAPLQWLVAALLPDMLIQEVIGKTLWAAEALTDKSDTLKALEVSSFDEVVGCKLERCDVAANDVHNWAIGTAAALGAWDLAGPLAIAPALGSLFTLVFRTVKKIGLCYGYDTSTHAEEMIALEIFAAAASLYHRDKVAALKTIDLIAHSGNSPREQVVVTIEKVSHALSSNLTRRRSFASVPALGALVGSSTNAWLLKDIGWAARNIYANRRLEAAKALRAVPKVHVEVEELLKAS